MLQRITRAIFGAARPGMLARAAAGAALLACAASAQDKSGVQPNAVNLPAQAGSVKAIADGFEADLSSGGGAYSIPLEMMRQSTETTVNISLDYESGGGNGMVGFGWSLGFGWASELGGVLQRRTEHTLPRYVDGPNGIDDDGDGTVDEPDEVDTFVSEGGNLLVPLGDGYYLAQVLGANFRFSRYCNLGCDPGPPLPPDPGPTAPATRDPIYDPNPLEFSCAPAPTQQDGSVCQDGWLVQYPQGYGGFVGQTPQSRIVNPKTGEIFAWLLDEEFDTTQNRNLYKYTSFDDERNTNQKYIQEIEQVNYSTWSGDGCGATAPYDSFTFAYFVYEDREDMIESYESGFPVRTGKRLSEIIMGVQANEDLVAADPLLDLSRTGHVKGDFNNDGVPDYLVRRYKLNYAPGHWSYLTSVVQYGADNVTSLPPTSMTYGNCEIPDEIDVSSAVIHSVNTPPLLMDNPAVDFSELNGDGLVDILRTDPTGGVQRAYLNLGVSTQPNGEKVVTWSNAKAIGGDARSMNISLVEGTGASAYLADMDADGMADFVYDASGTYFFPLRQQAGVPVWGQRVKMNLGPQLQYPPSPFSSPATTYEDLNNDGLSDVMQSVDVGGRAYFRVWYNLGGYYYAQAQVANTENGLTLSDNGAGLEDFNGDGISDLVRIIPTGVEVEPGMGYAHYDTRRLANLPDFTLNTNEIQQASLGDLNSDGLPDLVIERAAPKEIWYWINLGDYRFDHRRKLTNVPTPYGVNAGVRWADVNGNTTDDLVYVDQTSTERFVAVDIGEAIQCNLIPGLMRTLDNGIGGTISFEYGSSVDYQLADAAAGRPWPDTVPEAQVVLKSKTESDGMGDEYVTRYVYHDGFYKYFADYDGWAGFGEAEEITEGGEGAPTLVHRMKFDVGRDDPAFRGNVIYESEEDENGQKFWEENTQYSKTVLHVGADGREVKQIAPYHRTRDYLERGQGTPRRTEEEYEYDNYGNVTLEANYGIVDGANRKAFNDETITRNLWTWNCYGWIVADPARIDIEDANGKRISRHEIYWDNETYLGDRFRWSITNGITREIFYPNAEDLTKFVETSRIKYDVSGNNGYLIDGLSVCDPDGEPDSNVGHYTILDYEDYFQEFNTIETQHVGSGKPDLVATYDWEYGYGTPIAARDFNGNETRFKYDNFGRIVAIIRPGDTDEFPTEEFEYGLALPFEGALINYVEDRRLDKAPNTPGLSHRDHYQINRIYYDGLGRELLEKHEAEPDPDTGKIRVVVSGSGNWSPRGNVSEDFNDYFTTIGTTLDEQMEYENFGDDGWTGLFEVDGEYKFLTEDEVPRTAHEFDAELREIKTTNPDGTVKTTTYEPLKQILADELDTDSANPAHDTPKAYTFDGQNRLVQVDEYVRLNDDGTPSPTLNMWSTKYAYRADGVLTDITDSQGNIRHYIYDGLGRLLSRNDPDIGITNTQYDDASNVVNAVDGKGLGTLYTYDGVNRVRTADYKDEGQPFSFGYSYDPTQPNSDTNRPDVAYYYDDAYQVPIGGGATAPTRNAIGNLVWVLDQWGSYYTSYDERNRYEWEVAFFPHPSNNALVMYQTNYYYDSQDHLTKVEFPDGDRVRYTYNERGLLESALGGEALHPDGGNRMLYRIAYNPSGERNTADYGDGTRITRSYDSRKRVIGIKVARKSDPANPLIDYKYTYDGVGNYIRIDDQRPATVHPSGDPLRNTQIITMDDLSRLSKVQYSFAAPGEPDANNGSINYRHDRLGNIISQTSDIVDVRNGHSLTNLGTLSTGGKLGSSNRDGFNDTSPGPNALTHVASAESVRDIEYDDSGALSVLDGVKLYYDDGGNLVQSEDNTFIAKYTYDYNGLRVLRRVWDKDANGKIGEHPRTFVQYLGTYFEVRDNEQTIKYVFDDKDTLALASGTIETGLTRYQRILVSPGWNLLSMAIDAPDTLAQMNLGQPHALAAWVIDPVTGIETPLQAGDPLPAGSAFWLFSLVPDVLEVAGTYDDTLSQRATKQGFVALGRIGETKLSAVLPANAQSVWSWDDTNQNWDVQVYGDQSFLSNLNGFVENGHAFYVRLSGPGDITSASKESGVDYYHPDHLSSSNIITDGAGNVVQEVTFYPFGAVRAQKNAPLHTPNPYLFINREEDPETRLQSFEERYLDSEFGRFVTSDPVLEEVPDDYLQDPQLLNPYAYSRNNPLSLYDPQGDTPDDVKTDDPYEGLAALFQDPPKPTPPPVPSRIGRPPLPSRNPPPVPSRAGRPPLPRRPPNRPAPQAPKVPNKLEQIDVANFAKQLDKALTDAVVAARDRGINNLDVSSIRKALFDTKTTTDANGNTVTEVVLKERIKKQIEQGNEFLKKAETQAKVEELNKKFTDNAALRNKALKAVQDREALINATQLPQPGGNP